MYATCLGHELLDLDIQTHNLFLNLVLARIEQLKAKT